MTRHTTEILAQHFLIKTMQACPIQIHLSIEQWRQLDRISSRCGLSVRDYCFDAVIKAAQKDAPKVAGMVRQYSGLSPSQLAL